MIWNKIKKLLLAISILGGTGGGFALGYVYKDEITTTFQKPEVIWGTSASAISILLLSLIIYLIFKLKAPFDRKKKLQELQIKNEEKKLLENA